jgi:osmotically-inducible protein OsmY
MSEILGHREYDKARIVVNAENGVVVLRGEVDTPGQFRHLEWEVERLPGVAGVKNFLHLKGSTPTNKLPSLEASRRAMR